MNPTEWQARIECGGQVAGAGFLVTPTKVLTCAHVVAGSGHGSPLTVTFPQRPGDAPVPAQVVVHGGWGRATDPGDLAVLELDREVPVTPAALAPADTAHGDRKLVAYGFPRGYDEGTLAEYRTAGPVLISGEWIQLEAWSGYGQPLAAGFSGAAVALVDTGEVVGMVTAAAGAREVRTGRMMPTHVMARYWPDLGGLLPSPGAAHSDGARLRGLVEKALRSGLDCDPVRLYADAAGPFDPLPPPEGFDSLWSAAWFVLCEVDDAATVTRFADRLDALLHAPPRPAAGTAPDWSPILVELGHSGAGDDLVRVEVSAYSGGRRHPVGSDTVPQGRLPAYVQERIEAAFCHLTPGADELIAFALPRDWLDWPVDRWDNGPDDTTPLGCVYPVVVTDHGRRRAGTRHVLTRAWQRLDASRAGSRMQRVPCGSPEDARKLRLRLRQGQACVAGFGAEPGSARVRPHFEASLTAPAPVIVWSRRGCAAADGCVGDCSGTAFLDALDARFLDLPPLELPRSILELREEAEAEDEHWARDIQLLWDDPRCFTDPHATAVHVQSPVT
ncbi:trypsin-like peptidase domain-containing protein [Streptomyces sp. NPDC050803]|uniref:VMAP-C domain-containing protein n=1 Tax=unclassified Streptomyces TaxID=2593676 RepID=UPI003433A8F2